MSGEENKKKKSTGDQAAYISLKVKGHDKIDLFFKMKRSNTLKKLMRAYCDRKSVDIYSIVFLFDGHCLRAEQTPDELEMEDNDEVDGMLHL